MTEVLKWDIWEVSSSEESIHGVMFRGRIRKFTLQENITCLVENATDKENIVRFALLKGEKSDIVINFIKKLLQNVEVRGVAVSVANPVLSKLKVNTEDRYTI